MPQSVTCDSYPPSSRTCIDKTHLFGCLLRNRVSRSRSRIRRGAGWPSTAQAGNFAVQRTQQRKQLALAQGAGVAVHEAEGQGVRWSGLLRGPLGSVPSRLGLPLHRRARMRGPDWCRQHDGRDVLW